MNVFVDSVPTDLIIGIDFYSFNLSKNHPFHGIKNIPLESNFHIIYFQHNDNGMRYGYWFTKDFDSYIVFHYDPVSELYEPVLISGEDGKQNKEARLRSCSHLMLSYPDGERSEIWITLTCYMKWHDILYWVDESSPDSPFAYVDSSITTSEENSMLYKTMRNQSNTSRQIVAPEREPVLKYTPICFKSPEAIRFSHKTSDYLDKSWYLNHVILTRYHYNSYYSLLGELQFSFLNALLFSNYGSSLQWHNIIELLCRSTDLKPTELGPLDLLLAAQLKILPFEYTETLLNVKVWVTCMFPTNSTLPYHVKSLPLTLEAIEKILPDEAFDSIENNSLHSTNSDTDDEFQPVVANKVCYRHPPD